MTNNHSQPAPDHCGPTTKGTPNNKHTSARTDAGPAKELNQK